MKTVKTNNKRVAKRKAVTTITVSNLMISSQFEAVARFGHLVDVSSSGFLVQIDRQDIIPKKLKQNLSIKELEGEAITLMIDPMELEINGYIARTKYIGEGIFEVAIDFSEDAPEYWRECLYDLIPGANEKMYSDDE